MNKFNILFIVIAAGIILTSCTNYVARPAVITDEEVFPQEQIQITETTENEQTTSSVQQTDSPTKEFNVIIGHTSYNPSTFTVNVGDTIRFLATTARGTSTHNHGITIDEYRINQAVTSENIPVTIEFAADRAGTFNIWCRTCWDGPFGRGHPNIRGTLVVDE